MSHAAKALGLSRSALVPAAPALRIVTGACGLISSRASADQPVHHLRTAGARREVAPAILRRLAHARPPRPADGARRRAAGHRGLAGPALVRRLLPQLRWTLTLLVVGARGGGSPSRCATRVVFPLQTISNLLAALREDDFSIRARGSRRARSARRGPDRGQRAGRHAARAAHGRARRERAARRGDGGDPRRRLRVRLRSTPAAREPRRRAPAGAAVRAADRPRRGGARPGDGPRTRALAHDCRDVPRRVRPLGGAEQGVPPGRTARSNCSCSPT